MRIVFAHHSVGYERVTHEHPAPNRKKNAGITGSAIITPMLGPPVIYPKRLLYLGFEMAKGANCSKLLYTTVVQN
jgi:hypothetical protein